MSSLLFVEGISNTDENTWRHHTCPRFSLLKVIRISMRIPEDIIHVLVPLCWRWFEYRWEYLKTSYISSFLFVEGDSNIDENTWRHHTRPRSSLLKVIWITMRMPEDIIHVLVSLCWRWFEYWWEYLKTSYMSSFLFEGDLNIDENTSSILCITSFLFVEGYSNVNENAWSIHCITSFLFVKGYSNVDENTWHIPWITSFLLYRRLFECRWEYLKHTLCNFVSLLSKVIQISMRYFSSHILIFHNLYPPFRLVFLWTPFITHHSFLQ